MTAHARAMSVLRLFSTPKRGCPPLGLVNATMVGFATRGNAAGYEQTRPPPYGHMSHLVRIEALWT